MNGIPSVAVIDGHAVHTRADAYVVNAVPDDDPEAHYWQVRVEHAGGGLWAVRQAGRACLDADGNWDWEMRPSSRTDEWLATHRFDLDTALSLARAAAPKVEVNGLTPAALRERRARQQAAR